MLPPQGQLADQPGQLMLYDVYEGRNMLETHKGMNIDEAEFMAVVDDILDSLDKNSIAQREQEEVLFALYSMRREIILV